MASKPLTSFFGRSSTKVPVKKNQRSLSDCTSSSRKKPCLVIEKENELETEVQYVPAPQPKVAGSSSAERTVPKPSSQPTASGNQVVAVNDESCLEDSVVLSDDNNDCEVNFPALKDCLDVLNIQRSESRAIRKHLERPQASNRLQATEELTPVFCEKVELNGKIMKDLPGKTPGKYGLNRFKEFLNLSERTKGLAQPVSSGKYELDPVRMGKIQQLVEARFRGQWLEVRKSINECVRDSRKKMLKIQISTDYAVESSEASDNPGAIIASSSA